jgi:hypothetical protein
MDFEKMQELTKFSAIPSVFTEAVYLIEGKPFRFTGRNYLKTIYDTDIKLGLLKTGRQVEKSTTVSIKMGNGVLLKPFNRVLFVAPRNEQVKTFSKERLSKLFRYSKENIVRKFYMSNDLSDAVYMKEFTNGSSVWLRHCFEQGDNIRGLSIDDLYIDEVQDILVDAIPVIQETQFASDSPSTWFTGTPKTFSNTIESLWQSSTKGEWVIKCSSCNCYQILGIKNITDKYLQCRKCGKEITSEDIGQGFWVESNPGRPLKGFHISQMMSPRAKMVSEDGKGVYQKMISYPTAKFHNEVLGLSYENADKLITDVMLDDVMDNDEPLYDRLPEKYALNRVFMGVDWGTGEKSYTVVTIFTYNSDDKFQLLFCKKYDTGNEMEVEKQLEHISLLMKLFKVSLCVVDWGFGFHQIQRLTKQFGKRIAVCYYTHQQKEKIVYDEGKDIYKVRRTDIIMDYILDMLHNRGAMWPGKVPSTLHFLREHHLVEQAEYRTALNGRSEEMIFTHPADSPDDGLHSCVYSYLASKLFNMGAFGVKSQNGEITFTTVRTR